MRWAAVAAEGSQFRSRDLFPQAAASIVLGRSGSLGDAIKQNDIPGVPGNRIAYIDGYGNLKTTVGADQKRPPTGAVITVTIGDRTERAVISDDSFGVPVSQLAFAPGSSGWTVGGRETRWMELFLRGASAWEMFGRPAIGTPIHLEWTP